MKVVSKTDLGELRKPRTKDVEVSDYIFRIRMMNAREASEWAEFVSNEENKPTPIQIISRLLSQCVVDEDCKALFTEEEIGDLDAQLVNELGELAVDFNEIGDRNREKLEKN